MTKTIDIREIWSSIWNDSAIYKMPSWFLGFVVAAVKCPGVQGQLRSSVRWRMACVLVLPGNLSTRCPYLGMHMRCYCSRAGCARAEEVPRWVTAGSMGLRRTDCSVTSLGDVFEGLPQPQEARPDVVRACLRRRARGRVAVGLSTSGRGRHPRLCRDLTSVLPRKRTHHVIL